MAVEVDPDDGARDTALVARIGARIRATHGVDRSLLARDGIADRLQLGELELTNHSFNMRAGERIVRAADFRFETLTRLWRAPGLV